METIRKAPILGTKVYLDNEPYNGQVYVLTDCRGDGREGLVYAYTYINGTCLVPLRDCIGDTICKKELAGREFIARDGYVYNY